MARSKELGWTSIPSSIMDLNDVDAELTMIDENLMRKELSVLQRAEYLRRRKELYEMKHPETRAGVVGGITGGRGREKLATEIISFANDTSKKTGVTPRTVRQEVQIAGIDAEAKAALKDTPIADRKNDLLEIAQMSPEDQRDVAEKIVSGKARTLRNVTPKRPHTHAVETAPEGR